MATAASSRDDDSEALYWLKIAKGVLSGDIDPHNARAVLSARKAEAARPRLVRTPAGKR